MKVISDSNTIREVENIKHVYKAIQQVMFQKWLI